MMASVVTGLGGTPVLGGTQLPIRLLLERVALGDTREDMLSRYANLSTEQLAFIFALAGELGFLPGDVDSKAEEVS